MSKLATALFVAAALAATTASAQTTFRFGLRAGANAANQSVPAEYNFTGANFSRESKNSLLLAGQAGLAFEARFGRLALQPALVFSQKGYKNTRSTFDQLIASGPYNGYSAQVTTRTNWLELPLNLVYTFQGDHGFQVFAGPYVAVAVGGRETGSVTYTSSGGAPSQEFDIDQKLKYGENSGSRKRLDYGFNAGIGYRTGPVQLQAGYSMGLRNLGSGFFPSYNRGAQLTATYFWGN